MIFYFPGFNTTLNDGHNKRTAKMKKTKLNLRAFKAGHIRLLSFKFWLKVSLTVPIIRGRMVSQDQRTERFLIRSFSSGNERPSIHVDKNNCTLTFSPKNYPRGNGVFKRAPLKRVLPSVESVVKV